METEHLKYFKIYFLSSFKIVVDITSSFFIAYIEKITDNVCKSEFFKGFFRTAYL